MRFKYICIICPSVGSQTCFVDKLCVFASTIQVIRPRVKNSPNAPSFGKVGHQYLHSGIHHSGNELNFEYLGIFQFQNIFETVFSPHRPIHQNLNYLHHQYNDHGNKRDAKSNEPVCAIFPKYIYAWPKRHFTVFLGALRKVKAFLC